MHGTEPSIRETRGGNNLRLVSFRLLVDEARRAVPQNEPPMNGWEERAMVDELRNEDRPRYFNAGGNGVAMHNP